jgi:hypothetical protein
LAAGSTGPRPPAHGAGSVGAARAAKRGAVRNAS